MLLKIHTVKVLPASVKLSYIRQCMYSNVEVTHLRFLCCFYDLHHRRKWFQTREQEIVSLSKMTLNE